MDNALTRMLLLGGALLVFGGCAFATEHPDDVLYHKMGDVGDRVLVVIFPETATGKLRAHRKRSPTQVACWKVKPVSPGDGSDWRYGDGTVEVVSLSRTRVHLRVNATFPGGGAVSGDLVAPIRRTD